MTSHGSSHDLEDMDTLPRATDSLFTRYSRPLFESVRNGWQSHASAYLPLPSDETQKSPRWLQIAWSVVSAPRFRRYVVVYLTLFLLGWAGWGLLIHPRIKERGALLRSLDPSSKDEVGGWFGTNSPPKFEGLIQLQTLDAQLVPGAAAEGAEAKSKSRRRLIVVGDVHGCKEELVALLDKVSFSIVHGDHLIFAGDIINKGPDSGGVVDLAREYSASCVRGNHEDRILLARRQMVASNTLSQSDDSDEFSSAKELRERGLARSLTEEQVQWLEKCPVILKVGSIPGMGEVVVVHAGIVPGVDLEKQDPSSVMNMRTIDLKTHVPSSSRKGTNWAKMFDKHQSMLYKSVEESVADPESQTTTVIYGHDAKTGLNIRPYTKGLDSACVAGGKLTALVIEDGGKQSIVQTRCRKHDNQ
ncbi:hypothetical protein N7492_000417 [Penicillium capsulatum]|uniref:Calcineurin-like phosphoesterase domain-containing protein n=1 Tax=Penicillium capsulatum TaxID=69766 RepID=A0A9W9LYI5_9EURO|nr:hypothetical protein N7492_000417 [Penicillium capsulatum]KAJ6130520.1 hypothetical protein N7512_003300 [Penicillium capsulatum]